MKLLGIDTCVVCHYTVDLYKRINSALLLRLLSHMVHNKTQNFQINVWDHIDYIYVSWYEPEVENRSNLQDLICFTYFCQANQRILLSCQINIVKTDHT